MKKVLSLVLVIAMVLSSMSFAFAGTFADVKGDYEDAVNALVALGVVKGYEDGTFRPERTITRAELAKILVEALGYGNLVAGAASNYADTQNHWAAGYVAIASGTGLVIGYPNGTFLPDKAVTYDEALTMVVRALGYTDASVKGTWPTNFKVKAIDLDLTDDVVMASASADRGGVAQIIFNALEANLVTVDSDNNVRVETKVVKGDTVNKILLDKIAKFDPEYKVDADRLNKDSKKYAGNLVDLEPYMYETLEVYTNKDGDVVYVKGSNSIVVEGKVVKGDEKVGFIYVEDAAKKEHEIPVSGTASVYYNGKTATTIKMADIDTGYEYVKVVGLVEDDDTNTKIDAASEIQGVVAANQTDVKLIVNEYKEGRKNLDGIVLPVKDTKVDLTKVKVTGEVTDIFDIEEDDVVVAYAAESDAKVKLVVTRDTVEGKVTRLATNAAYVNGVKYSLNKVSKVTVELGNEGTFFLDHNGKIVAFEGDTVAPSDYAVLLANPAVGTIDDNTKFDDASYAIDDYPQIKLATQDDETIIYDIFVEIDEDDASVTDQAAYKVYGAKDTLVTVDVDNLELQLDAALAKDALIKYNVNADGKIDSIEVIRTTTLTAIKTDVTSFKLADGAVVFNSADKYDVVSASKLEKTISGLGVYNKNGELTVIITADVEGEADDAVYAKVEGITEAYNSSDDKVQVATVYMNGEEKELYADDTNVITGGEGIYKLELDGNVITKATLVELDDEVKIQSVSTRNNMVKIADVWYTIADNALVYTMDADDEVEFMDVYDLDPDMYVKVITNADLEVLYLEVVPAPVKGDGEASSILSVTEDVTGKVLTVTFSRPVYIYSGGGYDPEDEGLWRYTDASDGGVVINSVVLNSTHLIATVTLSGAAGDGDTIEAGDFHTIDMQCFGYPDSATRDLGTWSLDAYW